MAVLWAGKGSYWGAVTIIRELLGVKGVTGDLNVIILTLVSRKIILEVYDT